MSDIAVNITVQTEERLTHSVTFCCLLETNSTHGNWGHFDSPAKCQTPLHGHRLRTPPMDELTAILQLVVQQIHHQRTKFATSQCVEMLGSGIAMWQICCRIVVSLSVGGTVQHVSSRCPCSGVWALDNKCSSLACKCRYIKYMNKKPMQ